MTTFLLIGGGLLLFIVVLKMALREAKGSGRLLERNEELKKSTENVSLAQRIRNNLNRNADELKRLREKFTRK